MTETASTSLVRKAQLEEYVSQIFQAAGLDSSDSQTIARHLVLANLRGVDSHGVSRVEIYTRRLEMGLINKRPQVSLPRETASSALMDGDDGFGIVLASEGIRLAVQKAKETGIALVGIRRSNHCGMLADYTHYAADNDCLALAVTNAPANMAPWGGKERFFGTNPFSYGIPTGGDFPIVFDMATSVVARGKIIVAEKNQQQIPLGWAISKDGVPTTNPTEALDGLVLPMAGPKGYGITFLVETLSALLTGSAFGPYIADLYKDFSRPQNVGQCFIVIRADLFEPISEFKSRMDLMIQEIRNIPRMNGVDRIYLPGEIEQEKAIERERNGIPLSPEIFEELIRVGKRYGIKPKF